MVTPIKGCKYDVVARCNGESLGVLETLEYDDGVNFDEWLAEVHVASILMLIEDSTADEYLVVMRTEEEEGYYRGIVVCSIPPKP